MNVASFSEQKTRRVIQMNTMGVFYRSCLSSQCEYYEKIFEQRSELQVVKCLIVHLVSSSFIVSSLEL